MTALRLRLRRMAGAPDRPSPFAIWADPAGWPTIPKNSQDVFVARALEALGVAQGGMSWRGCTYEDQDTWRPETFVLAEPLLMALGIGWEDGGKLHHIRAYVLSVGRGASVKKIDLPREMWGDGGDGLLMLRSCRHPDPPAGSDGLIYLSRPDFLAFVRSLPLLAPGERMDAARLAELVPPIGGRRVKAPDRREKLLARIEAHSLHAREGFHAAALAVWADLRREGAEHVHPRAESFYQMMRRARASRCRSE